MMNLSVNNFSLYIEKSLVMPFGIEFTKNFQQEPGVKLGSVVNLAGYIDCFERHIGVARLAIGLFSLACVKETSKRFCAAGMVLRGVLEMNGDFEGHLLTLDILFTIANIVYKTLCNNSYQSENDKKFNTGSQRVQKIW